MFLFKQKSIKLTYSVVRYLSHQVVNHGTIFSLSSGHGKCGVAIIRVSGPQTSTAVQRLSNNVDLPMPRKCHLMKFYHPKSLEAIDKGLLLWFPGPRSFTGEDCAEFQIHGGPAVVMAMYEALSTIPGLRTAEAGEFSKRAFMNNKLDLTEVEGLGDLIHAETEIQRKQALRQMDGDLRKLYMKWRKRLIKCTANVEAYIDFSEEENIEEGVVKHVNLEIDRLITEIEDHLKDNRRGERLRSGVNIAIIGEPNVGKSSLLNILCRRPAAIVSSIPGTTRDIIESALNIGGYPVLLSDTAGLRQSHDHIEQEGIKRALQRASLSDIKLVVVDASTFQHGNRNLQEFLTEHLQDLKVLPSETPDNTSQSVSQESDQMLSDVILVLNKIDLLPGPICLSAETIDALCVRISCHTEEGIDDFVNLLTNKIKNLCGNPLAGNPSLTQTRHRTHLQNCHQHLQVYQDHILQDDVVLAAHHLHLALREIGQITGKISSEDILDVVFKDFCIGK